MATAAKSKRTQKQDAPSPLDRRANAAAAAAHAAKGTKAAGQAVGALASRARKPLVVVGAAAAGVAGGLALFKRTGR
jgi:hypothetical protein